MASMGSPPADLPDWERLLAAERHLQHLLPGAILVGGSAAAVHVGHRVSMDGDHVLEDLRERFDASWRHWSRPPGGRRSECNVPC